MLPGNHLNQQDFSQTTSDNQLQNSHDIRPSLINKSSIRCVTLSNHDLTSLPTIATNIQRLDLSNNKLTEFSIFLPNLKQLEISNNFIEKISDDFNNMLSLCILKANHNKIKVFPYLKHLRHLELTNNPINILTTRVSQMHIQQIKFDWLTYLVDPYCPNSWSHLVQIVSKAIEGIEQAYFVDFNMLFKFSKLTNKKIEDCLYLAIKKKHDFFIDFLIQEHQSINYNCLKINAHFILQESLSYDYKKSLSLYKLRRSNLNQQAVFLQNLLLSCKYGELELFDYILGKGLKRMLLVDRQEQIIDCIFKNFDYRWSIAMLIKIMGYCDFNQNNQKTFVLPDSYSILQSENIAQGLVYVMRHDILKNIFNFEYAATQYSIQPLLHFAMQNRKPELVQLILKKFSNPFIKNYEGKLAKNIRGSIFSRKLVWKYEKKLIKQLFSEEQTQRKTQTKTINWFSFNSKNNKYPKGQKIFSSPAKPHYGHGQSLMGSRMQNIQRSAQNRKAINKLKASRSMILNQSVLVEQCDDLMQEDQTGVIFDFVLNMNKSSNVNSSEQLLKKMNQNTNSLVFYETFQNCLSGKVTRDYKQNVVPIPVRTSLSFFSSLNLCSEVENNESQKQVQIDSNYGQSGDRCLNPCYDRYSSIDTVV